MSFAEDMAKAFSKKKKGWKFKTDNKLRGAFGETDFAKKTVRINKKKHVDKKALARERRYNRLKNGHESMLDTIAHELDHVAKPNATERATAKHAKQGIKKLSTRKKRKLYRLFEK